MSERSGDLLEDRVRLEASAYSGLLFAAQMTGGAIADSWKRPKRHNRTIQRTALQSAISLDEHCQVAIAKGRDLPSSTVASVETRYEVQAGIRTVRAILPFTLEERAELRQPEMRYSLGSGDEATIPKRALLERWYEWLWTDGRGEHQTNFEMLGESAILATGCWRLTERLPEVIDGIALKL